MIARPRVRAKLICAATTAPIVLVNREVARTRIRHWLRDLYSFSGAIIFVPRKYYVGVLINSSSV